MRTDRGTGSAADGQRPLQQAAETLLEQALQRRRLRLPDARPPEGRLSFSTRERGNPGRCVGPDLRSERIWRRQSVGRRATARRPGQSAVQSHDPDGDPAGSVFKVATAAALLQEGAIRPGEPMHCQGYLRSPDRLRCRHLPPTRCRARRGDPLRRLVRELQRLLPPPCRTARLDTDCRLGLATRVRASDRIDLPQEASGRLPLPRPVPEDGIDRHAELPSIGQGELTATPIQVARMMAAVANGGKLVTPHVVRGYGLPVADDATSGIRLRPRGTSSPSLRPEPIEGLSPAVLARDPCRAAPNRDRSRRHRLRRRSATRRSVGPERPARPKPASTARSTPGSPATPLPTSLESPSSSSSSTPAMRPNRPFLWRNGW